MKITAVQTNSITDKGKNIAQAKGLMERAVEADRPDGRVLPEVWNWRGGTTKAKIANADAVPTWNAGDEFEAARKAAIAALAAHQTSAEK